MEPKDKPARIQTAVPEGPHNDWPEPLNKVPRKWTAIPSKSAPKQLLGNAEGNLDIPKPGKWTFAWPFYFALTTKGGWHFRLGARYDYVDEYYQVPSVTLKKIEFKQ